MENVLQEIVTHEVKKYYETEKEYYENELNITQQSWNRWKRGERGFGEENMAIIKRLFTDYEWMIVQKIINDLEEHDEDNPYEFYLKVKKEVALHWLEQDVEIELTELEEPKIDIYYQVTFSQDMDLSIDKNSDVITFDLSKTKGKLKNKKKKQIKWLKKNEKFII